MQTRFNSNFAFLISLHYKSRFYTMKTLYNNRNFPLAIGVKVTETILIEKPVQTILFEHILLLSDIITKRRGCRFPYTADTSLGVQVDWNWKSVCFLLTEGPKVQSRGTWTHSLTHKRNLLCNSCTCLSYKNSRNLAELRRGFL